jgi:hypothetical protein
MGESDYASANEINVSIGIGMSEKKWDEMGRHIYEHLTGNSFVTDKKIIVRRIKSKEDLEEGMGYMDVIVHKWNDIMMNHSNLDGLLSMDDVLSYMRKKSMHGCKVVLLEPLDRLNVLLDRKLLQETILEHILPMAKDISSRENRGEFDILTPKYCITSKPIMDLEIKDKFPSFPIVCKSLEACSTEASHSMEIYESREAFIDTYKLKGDMDSILVQEFIPHKHIYKVFVLGKELFITCREFSIPGNDRGSSVRFNSQSLPKGDVLIFCGGIDSRDDPCDYSIDSIKSVAIALREYLCMQLFGFDLIRSHVSASPWYIIDVNYFPTYKGIPNRIGKLCEYILENCGFSA